MSTDIERLLAEAADDTDQPMHSTVDDLLIKARRSVRHRRIATVTTAALTTAVVIGGIATWSGTQTRGEGPASTTKQTITVDNRGLIVDNESGLTVGPPPAVSPLSDAEVLARCKQYDREYVEFLTERNANTYDKAGTINARWQVVVKSGDKNLLEAMFLSPDKSIVSTCTMDSKGKPATNGRISTAVLPDVQGKSDAGPGGGPLHPPTGSQEVPAAETAGLRVPTDVTHVLVNIAGESTPRQALLGAEGFYTLGYAGGHQELRVERIRGYDATGKKTFELIQTSPTPPKTPKPVDPSVTIKTVDPITPEVVLSKDPATGKALAAATPVSPLSDEQVRDRCALWEHEINTNPVYGQSGAVKDPRDKAAGPITQSWSVALKTGTGDKLTALLVSPDRKVLVWCHMTTPTTKGGENDFTRTAVKADGTFGDAFHFGMVPEGVAQIVVDLPKFGPTKALISNGFYIWGVTGGNDDIQNVRIRGFDAQGKQVYNTKQQLDAS
ncbi:hypothetical protein [Kribbella sp. NPDC055071]